MRFPHAAGPLIHCGGALSPPPADDEGGGGRMPGQIVHIEIPADDTEQGREFYGSLFGWQFESYPGLGVP